MHNGTMFYLLDLVDHSWTMGLSFGGIVLNQPNLIKAKKMTLSCKLFQRHSNGVGACIYIYILYIYIYLFIIKINFHNIVQEYMFEITSCVHHNTM
jgi:hypothetical protein